MSYIHIVNHAHATKSPHTLHTKLQKMHAVIFHTHDNFFPQLQRFFSQFLI